MAKARQATAAPAAAINNILLRRLPLLQQQRKERESEVDWPGFNTRLGRGKRCRRRNEKL